MSTNQQSVNSAIERGNRIVVDIVAAIRAQDYDRASLLADTLLSLGVEHAMAYNARALAFQQKKQYREALSEFTRARALSPNDTNLLNAIGVCLINLNQPADAIQAFDSALAANPRNAQAQFRKGWTLEMLGERDDAKRCFEQAIAIDPNHADALASLAAAIAIGGKVAEGLPYAERALAINPLQPTAKVTVGMADLARGDYVSAEKNFRFVLDDPQLTYRARAVVHGLLADALDGQDRVDEAFEAYRFEKNEIRQLYAHTYVTQQRPREVADRIADFLDAAPAAAPEQAGEHGIDGFRPTAHAFLVGFPRSGTTLLEQILASHPQIRALEEQDYLADAAQTYLTSPEGLRKLALLDGEELERLRKDYWERVRARGLDIDGKIFVDKLPMNTIKLPLIAKLFPGARIIFALRDPRDVILSCYRRHFEMNAAMFEFLSLEDAVDLYGAVMRLGVLAQEKLPLAFHAYRYEDTVADLKKSVSAVCAFIGADWDDSMAEFHAAETNLDVRSPSAAQIRRPLNPDSIGVWHRYAGHLAVVLPRLRPWAERFGYAKD